MAAQIRKLPGINCTFYIFGHCIYNEHRNPGDNVEWQCSEITRFLKAYDEFVDRADRFALSDEKAGDIWDVREASLPPAGALCDLYEPDSCKGCSRDSCLTDCRYEQNLICALKLPVCTGVCRRYRHSRTSDAASCCSR